MMGFSFSFPHSSDRQWVRVTSSMIYLFIFAPTMYYTHHIHSGRRAMGQILQSLLHRRGTRVKGKYTNLSCPTRFELWAHAHFPSLCVPLAYQTPQKEDDVEESHTAGKR